LDNVGRINLELHCDVDCGLRISGTGKMPSLIHSLKSSASHSDTTVIGLLEVFG